VFKLFRRKKFKLGGWQPDPANKKYYKFDRSKLSLSKSNNQYQSGDDVDLRPYTSPRHDQGATGSCVGQSTIKALEIKRIMKHGHEKHTDLSVLNLYYNARDRMTPSQVKKDEGTYISLACDVLRDIGVCRDELHPFKVRDVTKKPTLLAARESRLNRITSHFKIKSQGKELLEDMIFNLKAGNPIIFGTQVGDQWFGYRGGKTIGVENKPKGGHAMVVVGYVDGIFIVENSWGTQWGDDGFAYVKPEVFTHPSTRDLWVIVDGSEAWTEK